jgi:hypothetical protein
MSLKFKGQTWKANKNKSDNRPNTQGRVTPKMNSD